MSNALLSFPDRTMEAATALSGGSWRTGFTLLSLQNALLSKVARSTDATAAFTQFVVACAAPKDVRVIALLNHNITLAGTVRARGYSDVGLTALVYDTGTQFAWPQTFTADMVAAYPNNWIFPTAAIQTARYWKIEIVDTTNSAGYVQIGRCWLGPAFEPAIGIADGLTLGYVSGDVLTSSIGDVDWANRGGQRRAAVMTFDTLDAAEKRTALVMQKTLGKSGEIMFVADKTAIVEDMLLESFPAKIREASAISYPYFGRNSLPLEVLEII